MNRDLVDCAAKLGLVLRRSHRPGRFLLVDRQKGWLVGNEHVDEQSVVAALKAREENQLGLPA